MTFVIIFMCVESDLWWHHGNRINMWPLHSALECLAWLATVHYMQTVKSVIPECGFQAALRN